MWSIETGRQKEKLSTNVSDVVILFPFIGNENVIINRARSSSFRYICNDFKI